MASFYVWETVDFEIELSRESGEKVLEGCRNVIVSLEQKSHLLEKDLSSPDIAIDTENDTIVIHLSQEETGKFKPSTTDVILQVNFLYENEERDTSTQTTIKALKNLHKKVME